MPQNITPAILNAADQVESDLAALDVSTRTLVQLLRAGQGGGVTPPFAPDDVTNLELWLDASDSATITASGSAVSAWADKSANARSFTQATGSLQPATGTTTQNSLNTIDFLQDYLQCTSAAGAFKFMHDGTAHTIFFVGKHGNVANPNLNVYFAATCTGPTQIGFRHFFGDLDSVPWSGKVIAVVDNGTAAPVSALSADGLFAANAYRLLRLDMDPDNGTAADRATMTVNAGTPEQPNTNTNTPSASNETNAMWIGYGGSLATTYQGQMAEILVYSRALTSGEIDDVQGYLAAKWGITL